MQRAAEKMEYLDNEQKRKEKEKRYREKRKQYEQQKAKREAYKKQKAEKEEANKAKNGPPAKKKVLRDVDNNKSNQEAEVRALCFVVPCAGLGKYFMLWLLYTGRSCRYSSR